MDSLPPELRLIIYDECVNIGAHELLYVNRKFHDEYRAHFKTEDFVLGFHIDPSSSSTKVTIINPDNSARGRHSVLDIATPHPDYSILDSMPIDRFKGIRILIDPPNIHDPGQVVRGWLQSTALVTALLPRWADPEKIPDTEEDFLVPKSRVSTRVPPITIQIRDGKTHKWHTGRRWNTTLPPHTAWDRVQRRLVDGGKRLSDLNLMLWPLVRVRNADAISFDLPSDAPVDGSFEDLQNFLVSLGTRKKLFGLERTEDVSILEEPGEREDDDDDMQIEQDALHVWLDYLLDDMRGPSAAALRRDRFKFWCSEYEYQMGRRIHGSTGAIDRNIFGGARYTLGAVLTEAIKNSFHDRFMSAREHINGAYRDVLRRRGEPVYKLTDRRNDLNTHSLRVYAHGLRSEWADRRNPLIFWEVCYPAGIEPKSRNDNWEDTEQIRLRYRVEVPSETRDDTGSHIFPSNIAVCKHCDQDSPRIYDIMQTNRKRREYLFNFSTQPRPVRLGPLPEATLSCTEH